MPFWLAGAPVTLSTVSDPSTSGSIGATEGSSTSNTNYNESNYGTSFTIQKFIDDSLLSRTEEWWKDEDRCEALATKTETTKCLYYAPLVLLKGLRFWNEASFDR